jgi:LacI family transcriptional regulator
MVNHTPPKLEDVARLAGVSTATVSRCLNTPDKVIDATRKRVLEAVKQLGYMPNFGARALAAKRSNTIGAVIPTMENSIFARGLQAFQEKLTENNFDLLVASSSYKRASEYKQIRSLVARGAEGLLLIGTERDDEIYEFLADRNIHYVLSWSFHDNKDAPYHDHFVGFDNASSMAAMTGKVIDLGHKNIAMISGQRRDNDRAFERALGFKSAFDTRGLEFDASSIVEAQYDFADAGAVCQKMLQQSNPPTAIVCGNDVLAVGAIMRAQELGVNVPKDVSITGFDDIQIASVISPTLTTVHVPHRQMGHFAAKTLLDLIQNHAQIKSTKLSTHIVDRASLSAPKKS